MNLEWGRNIKLRFCNLRYYLTHKSWHFTYSLLICGTKNSMKTKTTSWKIIWILVYLIAFFPPQKSSLRGKQEILRKLTLERTVNIFLLAHLYAVTKISHLITVLKWCFLYQATIFWNKVWKPRLTRKLMSITLKLRVTSNSKWINF